MAQEVIQPRPQPREGLGCCLGKGCLIFVVLVIFLAVALVVGGYFGAYRVFTSTKPRELPKVQVSEPQRQEVLQRWENFQNALERPTPTPSTGATSPATTSPAVSQEQPTIDFSASDINQLIAGNRKARGHAFVSIENGVGHVAVSIPLEKVGFRGRYLNADFEVRSGPNGDPSNIQITTKALGGIQMPGRILNYLLGAHSLRGYVDSYVNEYRNDYDVTKFEIVGNKVIVQARGTP